MMASYVSACFFFSFFNLRVPFINFYSLYPHHTDVYALSGNATYLTRFQFSLFYHFFTLLQVRSFFSFNRSCRSRRTPPWLYRRCWAR